MNIFTYLKAFLHVRYEIGVQKSFNRQFLIPYMKMQEAKFGGHFQPAQEKKILKYYGLFIPSILCTSFKRLYGKTLSEEERKRSTLFGVLTPVFDDLFDIDDLPLDKIKEITFSPSTFEATTFSGNVAKEIQDYLINNVPHKEAYLQAVKNVFEIQKESYRQSKLEISDVEIGEITFAKGGYSVIIYHETLDEKAAPEMLKALFDVGALMQLANDCFDIYKDIHAGIFTLASRCNDYHGLKKLYVEKVKVANKSVMDLPYSIAKKNEFLVIMHAIISQGLVAIDQMIRLQKKAGKAIDPLQYERKELITDMAKIPNVLSWVRYAYTLPRLK